jgi:hypothetical protein
MKKKKKNKIKRIALTRYLLLKRLEQGCPPGQEDENLGDVVLQSFARLFVEQIDGLIKKKDKKQLDEFFSDFSKPYVTPRNNTKTNTKTKPRW